MTEQTTPQIAAIITKYLELREAVDRINAEAKTKKAELETAMSGIESYLMKLAIDTGQTNFGSADGTAFVTTETHCGVENFDYVLGFVKETGLWGMLTKGVSKTVVKEYLDEHGQLPPGIKWSAHKVIQIRKK